MDMFRGTIFSYLLAVTSFSPLIVLYIVAVATFTPFVQKASGWSREKSAIYSLALQAISFCAYIVLFSLIAYIFYEVLKKRGSPSHIFITFFISSWLSVFPINLAAAKIILRLSSSSQEGNVRDGYMLVSALFGCFLLIVPV
jgi:hypothetical protein